MSELHLLDVLAARRGCYISDLNLAPFLRRMALSDHAGWRKRLSAFYSMAGGGALPRRG